MKKALDTLKWAFCCQIIGVVCNFIAYFAPLGSEIKTGIFVFGNALIIGYIVMLFTAVYKPLKDNELK